MASLDGAEGAPFVLLVLLAEAAAEEGDSERRRAAQDEGLRAGLGGEVGGLRIADLGTGVGCFFSVSAP